jgi:hypothetical protein
VGFEELPPSEPGAVEPLLSLLDEGAGLLPPNIEPPVPVGLFPPTEELGGLLLVLGLLPPNMEPPPVGLLDPPLGLLELELRPFWAEAEVEKRNARANAPISGFVIRMSNPSVVEVSTPAMPPDDLLLTKTPVQPRAHHASIHDQVSLLCESILRFSPHI